MKNRLLPITSRIIPLKGFSLLEMVLVLSLSGLVIGIGGTIWKVSQHIHFYYQQQQQETYAALKFQLILERDASQALTCQSIDNKQWVLLSPQQDTVALYRQLDSTLARETGHQVSLFAFTGEIIELGSGQGLFLQDTLLQQTYSCWFWPLAQARPFQ